MSQFNQTTANILMVRPGAFGFNAETAVSNNYQMKLDMELSDLQKKAHDEFDAFVDRLRQAKVNVMVFQSPMDPVTPDAVFPNNWIRIGHGGKIDLFPMLAKNRRLERNQDLVTDLHEQFEIESVSDGLLEFEEKDQFLEGTGSIVFDHPRKRAYACISPRTHKDLFERYCQHIGYEAISFVAKRSDGQLQYHTNVVLAIGTKVVMGDFERFESKADRDKVESTLSENLKLIHLSGDQVEKSFCGNAIELLNTSGESVWVMSTTSWEAFSKDQQDLLSQDSHIVRAPLDVIEKVGGGSARCMIAEIFADLK